MKLIQQIEAVSSSSPEEPAQIDSLAQPIQNINRIGKVFELARNDPEFAHHYPYLNELLKNPIDNLVVLGHNWDRTKSHWPPVNTEGKSNIELSIPSKVNALSSFLLLDMGLVDNLIFSGGRTTEDTNQPTESRAMLDYIKNILSNSNQVDIDLSTVRILEKIILEEISFDTFSNAQAVKEITQRDEGKKLGLMSVGYHMLLRAKSIFRNNGVSVKANLNSENILADLYKFININQVELRETNPNLIKNFRRIRLELKLLTKNFSDYSKKPLYIEDGKIKLKAHRFEYHLLVRIYQLITQDPTGEKLNHKAKERRQGKNSVEDKPLVKTKES